MNQQNVMPDSRGGGDISRRDAFRYAPRGAVFAIVAIIALGVTAIAFVAYDVGGARESSDAGWLTLAGFFVILFALGLVWIALRRPVLLVIGPDGLDLPGAFEQPVPWTDIARVRRTRLRISLFHKLILLRVDLVDGTRPRYKRRLWTMPTVDSWLARKIGLRVPVQNLDADEETIIASIERFRAVEREAP